MEYILENTDIFDEDITSKFSKVIKNDMHNFIKEKPYRLKVSFHVNLLNNIKFEKFNIEVPSKTSRGTIKDKISDVMSFQLKRLEEILSENGIKVYSTAIQGDLLEKENIIKIEIIEDNAVPTYTGRGKNKQRLKVSCIIPSIAYTRETATKLASERLSEMFNDLMNGIRNKKIMSEILEIEETEDNNILYKAFVEQYGDLWFTTKEREKELLDRLKERGITVLNKYLVNDEK